MAVEGGQPQTPESILVVSLDNLGDVVFASALLPPIRRQFPSARIGLWCKSYTSGLAPLIPELNVTYAADPFWDSAPGTPKGSLLQFLSVAVSVRRARFGKGILAFAPWRTAAALAATGIPVRIGLERRRNRRWLTDVLPPEDRRKPVLEEVGRLLGPLGIESTSLVYRLDASGLTKEHAAVSAFIGNSSYAALHPFAGSESRCVKIDEWIRVANELSSSRLHVIWIGTAKELANVKRRARANENWRYSDSLSNGSLTAMAAAISRAKLFIGHDSGPMHIASALSIPTLGVFAPGEPARTFPQGRGVWRMISRDSPSEISARDILNEAGELLRDR